MDANAVNAALESVLARGSAPPDDGGAYIFAWRDSGGVYEATVFNATRFAVHDPEGYASWIMGKPDKERLNPPDPSDREAVALLPALLQKRIKRHEKQKSDSQSKPVRRVHLFQ